MWGAWHTATLPTPAEEGGRNQVALNMVGGLAQDLRGSILMGSLVWSGAGGCSGAGLLSPPTPSLQQPLHPSGCPATHVQWWHF